MAAAGESRWPYVDSDRWPMTSSPEARRAANGEAQKGHKSPIGSPSLLYRRVLHVRHLRCRIGSLLLVVRSRSGTRKQEGDNPSRVQPDWDEATGPVEYRPQSETPAPQSQPVTHASRLVTQNAPSVAFGHGPRIPAAGPAQLRLYSHSRRLRTPTANSLLRLIPMNQRTPAPTRSTGRDTTLPPARAQHPTRRDQTLGSDNLHQSRDGRHAGCLRVLKIVRSGHATHHDDGRCSPPQALP